MKNKLVRGRFSNIILRAAKSGRFRTRLLSLALRSEGGEFNSWTAREIMKVHFGVEIGTYSYGGCFEPKAFPVGTKIGRYVSIAAEVRALARNHPMDRISTHPAFFNANLGYLASDNVAFSTLEVGHDAWIGFRTIITPRCNRVGTGAVIGAGSVVTKDVPDFCVVAGNPAKIIRQPSAEFRRLSVKV